MDTKAFGDSVSICSNIDGYTDPACIVEPDQDLLVQKMIQTLTHVSTRAYELAVENCCWVLEAIEAKITEETYFGAEDDVYDENADDDEKQHQHSHPLKTLYGSLEGYISQIPVIGFNSANYDLNLIRRVLAKYLDMHQSESKRSFVIKKNNSYVCLATDALKFLDMNQYLAAGSSYAKFLKA